MKEAILKPDPDGGATCPCGRGFSFKVWLSDSWECSSCGRLFTVRREPMAKTEERKGE